MKNLLNKFILFLGFLAILTTSLFSQSSYKKGVELYQQGEYDQAKAHLRKASQKTEKSNPELWNYLGLTYIKLGKTNKAQRAFKKALNYKANHSAYYSNLAYSYLLERKSRKARSFCKKAIKLNQKNVNAYHIRGRSFLWESKFDQALSDAEKMIFIDSKFPAAYTLKADILRLTFNRGWAKAAGKKETKNYIAKNLTLLEKAVSALKVCMLNCEKAKENHRLSQKLKMMNAFYKYFKRYKTPKDPDSQSNPNTTGINILSKPRPGYPNSARQAGVEGTIILGVLFAADATIKQVELLKGLGSGLDQAAINAARKIKFEPERKDGKAISSVKLIQYNFTIY